MRIVCLITVGAFLLSIAMAEGEMPMGVQHYHQRVQRPIILEPLKKYKSNDEETPLHWFFNAVSRAMEPPPKPAPRIIGPINVPGLGGQVYIKEIHNTLPWESKHIVIRMMSKDPVNGMMVPMDASGVTRNRLESSSRRLVKPYVYQPINKYQVRPNNAIQQGFTPVASSHSSWPNQYRQRPHQYSASFSKPLRPSQHNDFRYENYHKEIDQSFSNQQSDDYRNSFKNNYQNFQPISGSEDGEANNESGTSVASPSMYQPIAQKIPIESDYSNDYNDQPFTETSKNSHRQREHFYNGKPDSIRSTQIPYPEYAPIRDEGVRSSVPRSIGNETKNIDTNSGARYRSVVRTDRMVPVIPKRRNNFFAPISRGRNGNIHNTQESRLSANFPIDTTTKFDSDDSSGIEVIAAPNLNRDWTERTRKIGNNQGLARSSAANSREVDSDFNEDEDSMSMGNGRNLARGESADHSNEQLTEIDTEKPVATRRKAQSRISTYNVIDRLHRSQGSQNITSASKERPDDKSVMEIDCKEDEKNLSIENNDRSIENISTIGKIDSTTKANNVTAEVVQKVMNLTANNRWRLTERRKPRIIKAIYRRKARFGVIKSSRESLESNESSNEKKSSESSK